MPDLDILSPAIRTDVGFISLDRALAHLLVSAPVTYLERLGLSKRDTIVVESGRQRLRTSTGRSSRLA